MLSEIDLAVAGYRAAYPERTFEFTAREASVWVEGVPDAFAQLLDKLVENASEKGRYFLSGLEALACKYPVISAVRGRGVMLAFDLPDAQTRDAFWKGAYELGLLVVRCGERSIRLRPVLDVKSKVIDEALKIMEQEVKRLS